MELKESKRRRMKGNEKKYQINSLVLYLLKAETIHLCSLNNHSKLKEKPKKKAEDFVYQMVKFF